MYQWVNRWWQFSDFKFYPGVNYARLVEPSLPHIIIVDNGWCKTKITYREFVTFPSLPCWVCNDFSSGHCVSVYPGVPWSFHVEGNDWRKLAPEIYTVVGLIVICLSWWSDITQATFNYILIIIRSFKTGHQ